MTTEEGLQAFQEQYNQGIKDGTFSQQLRSTMWERTAEVLPPLSDQQIQLLKQQSITATEPGMILKDFQTLLDFVGDRGASVSSTYHLFSLSLLKDINDRLSCPVLLDMKRISRLGRGVDNLIDFP